MILSVQYRTVRPSLALPVLLQLAEATTAVHREVGTVVVAAVDTEVEVMEVEAMEALLPVADGRSLSTTFVHPCIFTSITLASCLILIAMI